MYQRKAQKRSYTDHLATNRKKTTNPRNRMNADSARFRAVPNTKLTTLTHTAPAISRMGNTSAIKDFQSKVMYPQLYTDAFKQQGLPSAAANYGANFVIASPQSRPQCLSLVAQGNGNGDRQGSRIVCRSLNLTMQFRKGLLNANTVPTSNVSIGGINEAGENVDYYTGANNVGMTTCRAVVVIDNTPGSGICTAGDVFEKGGVLTQPGRAQDANQITCTSQLKSSTTSRFKVLRNELIQFNEGDTCMWSTFIDLSGLAITYSGAGATFDAIQNNGIYLFVLGAIGGNECFQSPSYTFSAKLKFIP